MYRVDMSGKGTALKSTEMLRIRAVWKGKVLYRNGKRRLNDGKQKDQNNTYR